MCNLWGGVYAENVKKFQNWDLHHFLVEYDALELSHLLHIKAMKYAKSVLTKVVHRFVVCMNKQCGVLRIEFLELRHLIKTLLLYENLCICMREILM